MVILPINKKLKKIVHKNVALAQDIVMMEIFNHYPNAVIHGGTATWRCYENNRFSEDIDVYLPLTQKKTDFKDFLNDLNKKGFIINKFKKTNNSIFAKFSYLGVEIRFEVVFKNIKNFITKSFEMSDGTYILVNTLQPEELIKEKVSTYIKRKKVKDLYDIFYLLKFVENKQLVKNDLKKFVERFTKPLDEKELKTLIIVGSIPNVTEMLEVIKKWVE